MSAPGMPDAVPVTLLTGLAFGKADGRPPRCIGADVHW